MKKQPFSTSLVLALIVSTCLVSTPVKVNAGSTGVIGISEDSSAPSGDTFSPNNSLTPPEPAPGVNVEVGGDGSLSTSIEVQNSLNEAIANIISQTPEPNTCNANIISQIPEPNICNANVLAIVREGASASQAISELQSYLTNLGVRKASVRSLVTALMRLFGSQSASISGVSGNPKGLLANSEIAQKEASSIVDINQLNAAINAYNKIVMESSPELLQQLAKDPQFREIGKILKQLRAALNKK